jgi:hypothetical protein
MVPDVPPTTAITRRAADGNNGGNVQRPDPHADAGGAIVGSFDAPNDPTEEAAVRAIVDDYFLGWYDADPERMRRALHPLLAKRGYTREGDGAFMLEPVDAAQMIAWAGAGHGRRPDPADRAYETRVVEIHDGVAVTVSHSVPYVEYLHLVKTDEGWKIINALWTRP